MKNFLTEKMLLDTKYGSHCTLEVCTVGDPDADIVLFEGTCGDCLRKVASHELSFSGDEYFCLYTNKGSFDGINFNEVAWRMAYSPDALFEILGLDEPSEDVNQGKPTEFTILSLEECMDKVYGNTLVQYQKEDCISFAFSRVPVMEALDNPQMVIADLVELLKREENQPSWSALSQDLLAVVLENPFDMHFVEYDDVDWSEEKGEILWEEVCELGINGAVTCLEDGALVTVYAGAMGSIDWTGHPEYGKRCFEHEFENNVFIDKHKLSLESQIQAAQNISESQKAGLAQKQAKPSLNR